MPVLPPDLPAPPIARRRFNAWGLAALAAPLGGCGGGSPGGSPPASDAVGEGAETVHAQALPLVGVGMQGLLPWTIAGPSAQMLLPKALDRLADGRIALAWVEVAVPGARGSCRLQLRVQACQGACAAVSRTLMEGLVDPGAAVAVLPDGSALVAWREVQDPLPGRQPASLHRLLLQHFTPQGQAAGEPELVDSFLFNPVLEGGGRSLGAPAIGQWGDGSYVITWADVRRFSAFPGIATSIRSRRYAANGWAPEAARTVATGYREPAYTLTMPPASGGYVISHVPSPVAPLYQSILPLEFWNPLPDAPLQGLLPGSFLLSLGVCGSLLFAGRLDPASGRPVYTRERFEYSGHAVGSPAPLPALPLGGIALQAVEFLSLDKASSVGRVQAQRMDKYGRILGMPFEMPQGLHLLLDDGALLVAWTEGAPPGAQLLLQRFVPLPMGPAPGLAAV